ncbi:MAG: glycosyltransferase [Clostridia bacterium]|nr:glycosyltransferase [Clostridia bacterium]
MRILVVTDVLWRDDNGVGNSYSNIFKNFPDAEIANICCQQGVSNNRISSKCFQISEISILRNLKSATNPSGAVEKETIEVSEKGKKSNLFSFIKKSRLQIFFWLRNCIWKFGRWKSVELKKFIDDFQPDLIFAQLQDKMYLNNLVSYVQHYTGKPLCLYAWDDVYSLKQFSLSPLFWIDRFMQRRSIRKVVKQSQILYTISEAQKMEYAKSLKVRTELLYKGYLFEDEPQFNDKPEDTAKVLRILYTGNLYSGRYITLHHVCEALKKINLGGKKAKLFIYSATNLSEKQIARLNVEGSSYFMGKISEQEVQKLQKDADILLHLEPFSLKGSLLCRLSFSTKLVDYFYNAKCIFAVGHKRCSSMQYLKKFNAAVVTEDIDEIEQKLRELIENQDVQKEYARNAWMCGRQNHQIEDIQNKLVSDFKSLKS